jgi:site-specific DNA recombinase
VVSLIFEHCKAKRLGSRAIAMWLNERGYRTRSGRPWGHKAVLQILRNPVYAGDVVFRGVRHAAAHQPQVDEETFAACGEILDARGEDAAEKRRNPTDYLLSGLLRCERCGKSYLGTTAHGKLYRYRYYTCFSRHRYGRHGCEAERLPAERLDQVVIEALVRTYADTEIVGEAIRTSRAMADLQRPQLQEQLAAVEAELRKAEETRQRYFVAFEAGTMREEVCAERLQVLQQKLGELREHRAELTLAIESGRNPSVSEQDLQDIRGAIKTAIEHGSPQEQKALLKALVAEVRVESRQAIYPVFRIPEGGVRVLGQMVDPRGFEPLTF